MPNKNPESGIVFKFIFGFITTSIFALILFYSGVSPSLTFFGGKWLSISSLFLLGLGFGYLMAKLFGNTVYGVFTYINNWASSAAITRELTTHDKSKPLLIQSVEPRKVLHGIPIGLTTGFLFFLIYFIFQFKDTEFKNLSDVRDYIIPLTILTTFTFGTLRLDYLFFILNGLFAIIGIVLSLLGFISSPPPILFEISVIYFIGCIFGLIFTTLYNFFTLIFRNYCNEKINTKIAFGYDPRSNFNIVKSPRFDEEVAFNGRIQTLSYCLYKFRKNKNVSNRDKEILEIKKIILEATNSFKIVRKKFTKALSKNNRTWDNFTEFLRSWRIYFFKKGMPARDRSSLSFNLARVLDVDPSTGLKELVESLGDFLSTIDFAQEEHSKKFDMLKSIAPLVEQNLPFSKQRVHPRDLKKPPARPYTIAFVANGRLIKNYNPNDDKKFPLFPLIENISAKIDKKSEKDEHKLYIIGENLKGARVTTDASPEPQTIQHNLRGEIALESLENLTAIKIEKEDENNFSSILVEHDISPEDREKIANYCNKSASNQEDVGIPGIQIAKGLPQITSVTYYRFDRLKDETYNTEITIEGKNLGNTESVFLDGSPKNNKDAMSTFISFREPRNDHYVSKGTIVVQSARGQCTYRDNFVELEKDPMVDDIELFLKMVEKALLAFKNNEVVGKREIWSRIRVVTYFNPDENNHFVDGFRGDANIDGIEVHNLLVPNISMAHKVKVAIDKYLRENPADFREGLGPKTPEVRTKIIDNFMAEIDVIYALSASQYYTRATARFTDYPVPDLESARERERLNPRLYGKRDLKKNYLFTVSFKKLGEREPDIDFPNYSLKKGTHTAGFQPYHEEFASVAGCVALNVINATKRTIVHEFAHAMSSTVNGAIADEYADIFLFDSNEGKDPDPKYPNTPFYVNRIIRKQPFDGRFVVIPKIFMNFNGTYFFSDLNHISAERDWRAYFPERAKEGIPCTMDGGHGICEFDKLLQTFIYYRMISKLNRK